MADYSTAAAAAVEGLSEAGFVEEYDIRTNGRRVKRGNPLDQAKAVALLDGLAARRSGGLFRLAKFAEPTDVE